MPRTEILFGDSGLAVGAHGNVFLTVLHEPTNMARLREVRRHLERVRKRCPDTLCGLTVLGPGALVLDLPKEIRDESTAITRDNPTAGNTIVVEGSGFGSSATRAFLSGMLLITRVRGKIHGTVEEGAAWLAPLASSVGKLALTPAELVGAVAEARAAIGRR